MAIYLKFGNLKGNVTAAKFKDQIAVDSVHFAVSRSVTMESGNLSNRESAKPQLSEITISKKADSSAAGVFKEATTGSAGQAAVLTFVRTGKDDLTPYMSYELSDCIVSSYSITAQGDAEPVENISLSYTKLVVSYTNHDATNAAGTPMRVMYDVKLGKPG
jgi:type VI secretion system secreted protein Hcp